MEIVRINFENHPGGLDPEQVGYTDKFTALLDDEFPTGRSTFLGQVMVTPDGQYAAKTPSMGSWGPPKATAAQSINALLARVVGDYRRVLADPKYRARAGTDPEVATAIARADASPFWSHEQAAVTMADMADLVEEMAAFGSQNGMPRGLIDRARKMISSARSAKTG